MTADFVKVYDLSVDVLSAQFYFLLPTGRVRDCCFVFSEDGQRHLLLMSSAGHVYYQPMLDESSARHGPFYVTNILDVKHPDIKVSIERPYTRTRKANASCGSGFTQFERILCLLCIMWFF